MRQVAEEDKPPTRKRGTPAAGEILTDYEGDARGSAGENQAARFPKGSREICGKLN